MAQAPLHSILKRPRTASNEQTCSVAGMLNIDSQLPPLKWSDAQSPITGPVSQEPTGVADHKRHKQATNGHGSDVSVTQAVFNTWILESLQRMNERLLRLHDALNGMQHALKTNDSGIKQIVQHIFAPPLSVPSCNGALEFQNAVTETDAVDGLTAAKESVQTVTKAVPAANLSSAMETFDKTSFQESVMQSTLQNIASNQNVPSV